MLHSKESTGCTRVCFALSKEPLPCGKDLRAGKPTVRRMRQPAVSTEHSGSSWQRVAGVSRSVSVCRLPIRYFLQHRHGHFVSLLAVKFSAAFQHQGDSLQPTASRQCHSVKISERAEAPGHRSQGVMLCDRHILSDTCLMSSSAKAGSRMPACHVVCCHACFSLPCLQGRASRGARSVLAERSASTLLQPQQLCATSCAIQAPQNPKSCQVREVCSAEDTAL